MVLFFKFYFSPLVDLDIVMISIGKKMEFSTRNRIYLVAL